LAKVGFSMAGEENVGDNDGRTGWIGLSATGIGVEKRENYAPPHRDSRLFSQRRKSTKPLHPRDRPVLFSSACSSNSSQYFSSPNPHPPKIRSMYTGSFSPRVSNPQASSLDHQALACLIGVFFNSQNHLDS
jgi:hypothetical protein